MTVPVEVVPEVTLTVRQGDPHNSERSLIR